MARRSIDMFELQNLLHWWQQGHPLEFIQRGLGIDPKTARKYIQLASEVGIQKDTPLSPEALAPLLVRLATVRREKAPPSPALTVLAGHHRRIGLWMGFIDEPDPERPQRPLRGKTVWRRLRREHGVGVSYSAFRRYIARSFAGEDRRVTVVMPTTAGEAAQVDFGCVGMMLDLRTGRRRRTWAFVMTLCHSRHMFVRFVFGQDQAEWVRCHVEAFEFFGGVVGRVALDNLKAGVVKPDLYDPILNKAYAECERHYGFVVDPCRVRRPTDKGKVERMVPYVRDALVGGYALDQIERANEVARAWCLGEAGERVHQTTGRKPLELFDSEERPALRPLPADRLDIALWKEATVHPDHHFVFEQGFYSLPTRYIGQKVWVRGGSDVRVFDHDGGLIRTWPWTTAKERRRTNPEDYPPGQRAFLTQHPAYCRSRAKDLGPSVLAVVESILARHAYAHLRKVQAILRLGEKFGAKRLDLACARALAYDDIELRTIKNILVSGKEAEDLVPAPTSEPVLTAMYLREPESFVHEPEPAVAMTGGGR